MAVGKDAIGKDAAGKDGAEQILRILRGRFAPDAMGVIFQDKPKFT